MNKFTSPSKLATILKQVKLKLLVDIEVKMQAHYMAKPRKFKTCRYMVLNIPNM
jgi:hypothetical protein